MRKKCKKTISGKHMWPKTWFNYRDCKACGIIDDTKPREYETEESRWYSAHGHWKSTDPDNRSFVEKFLNVTFMPY